MTNKTCPLCKKDLSLKQVNFNLAVYICEDLECKYPVGYDCIVVERKLEDMNKEVLDKDEDLDDWVSDIVKDNEKTTEDKNGKDTTINPESVEWIDNLVEEAVNEAKSYEVTTDNVPSVDATDFDDILNFIYSN